MWAWLLIPAAALGVVLGRWLPRKSARQEPPLTEEDRRALRELQKFLTYDGFNG